MLGDQDDQPKRPGSSSLEQSLLGAATDPVAPDAALSAEALPEIKIDFCHALVELRDFAAVPLITQFVNQILRSVNAGLLAREGSTALAAVNLVSTTMGVCSSISMMVSDLGRLVSRVKETAPEEVGTYFRQALVLSVVIGLALSVPLSFADELFEALGHTKEVGKVVEAYFWPLIQTGALVPFIGMMAQRRLFASLGMPKVAAALPLVNAGLTAAGAAVSSSQGYGPAGFGYSKSISNWATFLGFFGYLALDRRFAPYALFSLRKCVDCGKLGELVRSGLPVMASSTLECGLIAVVAGLVGHLGSDASQAYSAVNALALLPIIPIWTLAVYLGILMTRQTTNAAEADLAMGALSDERLALYRLRLQSQFLTGNAVSAGLVLAALALFVAAPTQCIRLFAGDMPSASLLIAESALIPAVAVGFADGARIMTSVGAAGVLGTSTRSAIANAVGLSAGTGLAALGVFNEFRC